MKNISEFANNSP